MACGADVETRVWRFKDVLVDDEIHSDSDGEAVEIIPGLFAAGNVVEYCAMGGWTCSASITQGRIAGKNAANYDPVA